jgi:hypothetical protein
MSNNFKWQREVEITDSSMIKFVRYSVTRGEMLITFANDDSYLYESISPQVFGAIVSTESPGSYFNAIKKTLRGTKV